MSLFASNLGPCGSCVPRASGDEPDLPAAQYFRPLCSPRERG